MTPSGAEVWRDYEVDGVPASGPHKPRKSGIRAWSAWIESLADSVSSGGGLIYQTQALLYADLAKAANEMAWVVQDATAANNGIYMKVGASGAGSWTRVADLPYSFIRATDVGDGTANAIEATTSIPVSASALVLLNVFEANTSSPVTIAFNDGAVLTIKSNSGNDIVIGGLVAGMQVLGVVVGSTFRIVTDQVSSAIVVAAEAAQLAAEEAAADAIAAASSLLFRLFDDQADAEAATIEGSATYLAIADYSPQPRFFKRFVSDPGVGDRFQSADGGWWQGLPVPPVTIDFANPVARAGNVTVTSVDFDQAHLWTIGSGTTYTVTLPDADANVGEVIHIGVSVGSEGLLAVACVDPVGKFVTGDLVLWAGESITLVARAGHWDIIGGKCIPAVAQAQNAGADIAVTWIASSGWTLLNTSAAFYPGAPFCLNAGAMVAPRKGFYEISFHAAIGWSTAPSFAYGMAHNTGNSAQRQFLAGTFSNLNNVFNHTMKLPMAKGAGFLPVVIWSGGSGVVVARTSIGTPIFTMTEIPQW